MVFKIQQPELQDIDFMYVAFLEEANKDEKQMDFIYLAENLRKAYMIKTELMLGNMPNEYNEGVWIHVRKLIKKYDLDKLHKGIKWIGQIK